MNLFCFDFELKTAGFVNSYSYFRHQSSDPSVPEFSCIQGDKVGKTEETTDVAHNIEQQEFDQGSLDGESLAEPIYDTSVAMELPQNLSCECAGPDCGGTSNCGMEFKCVSELAGSSTEVVPYAEIVSGKELIGREIRLEGPSHVDANKEAAGCDWENLFSEEGDLLLFDTPNDSKSLIDPSQRSLLSGMSFCTSLTDNMQIPGAVNAAGPDNSSSLLECGHDMQEVVKDQDIPVSHGQSVAGDTIEKVDNEVSAWLLPPLICINALSGP